MGERTSMRTWIERVALLVGSPLAFLLVSEAAIVGLGIETDLARNENARIAVPVWLLADETWVAHQRDGSLQAGEPLPAEDVAWLYHFEEARHIAYKLKPSVDVRAVNPFNPVDVREQISFHLQSNRAGFRDREFTPKPDGVFRVVTIGDSSTFGWGVEPEHTYQHQLEQLLDTHAPGAYEVINLGIPGHNSRHGVGMLTHYALPLEPDVLVVAYGANDGRWVPRTTDEMLATHDGWAGALRFAALRLRTYRLLRRILFTASDPLRRGADEETPRRVIDVPGQRFEANLSWMKRRIAESGAAGTVLVSVCAPGPYVAATASVARRLDVPMINVGRLFREALPGLRDGSLHPEKVEYTRQRYGTQLLENNTGFYVTNDGCHPNWTGHALIAEQLFGAVTQWAGPTAAIPDGASDRATTNERGDP